MMVYGHSQGDGDGHALGWTGHGHGHGHGKFIKTSTRDDRQLNGLIETVSLMYVCM